VLQISHEALSVWADRCHCRLSGSASGAEAVRGVQPDDQQTAISASVYPPKINCFRINHGFDVGVSRFLSTFSWLSLHALISTYGAAAAVYLSKGGFLK
jgi:hypothetical protein